MPSPMVTQNTHADRETVISPEMGEAARERGEGEGGVTERECATCGDFYPETSFYKAPNKVSRISDCDGCRKDKQRMRNKLADVYDPRDDVDLVEAFNRRRA